MKNWWKEGVIYQIYPRSFLDTSGNGIGDLKGITKKINYLSSLGIDAIWISPFFKSPMKDMGYDVSDYTDVDPIFGSLKDFKLLLKKAHSKNIKVIIDQVLSHSSDKHPFFLESRKNKNNPKSDWYVWADPKSDGSPPNNWLSIFGGPAWEWDTGRQQYYFHNFLKSQPDFNFHNKLVQEWILSRVKFWLDLGVDGFRLDTANYYFHDTKLRNNPKKIIKKEGTEVTNPYYMQNHKYSINQKENLEFIKRLRSLTDQYSNIAMVGEIADPLLQAKYTSGKDKLHMAYSFELLRGKLDAKLIKNTVDSFYTNSKDGWPCWSFSNHDVVRHLSRWNKSKKNEKKFAKLTCALLLSLKGTPCIFQGEELGQTQTKIEFNEIKDPPGKKFWPMDFGRDGCRTPMVWDEKQRHVGFSKGKPWLPIKKEQAKNALKNQVAKESSVYNFYKEFLFARKKFPQFKEAICFKKDKNLLIFYRGENKELSCIFNLSSKEVSTKNLYGKLLRSIPSQNIRAEEKEIVLSDYGFGYFVDNKKMNLRGNFFQNSFSNL
tara:strand:- start:11333 stop:12967 length:1635 start_codon:yes stop_codon:yes gene_type:complete